MNALTGYLLTRAEPIDKNDQIVDASGSYTVARMCLKIPFVKGRDSDEMNVCMQEFPAIAILGPRQVGKTTLAHQLMQQRTLALAGQRAWPLLSE